MQKLIKNLLQANSLLVALTLTVIIAFLSLFKLPESTFEVSHIDKLYHCIAYFVLSFFWFIYAGTKNKLTLTFVLCIIYGIIIEILQHAFTDYRSGDVLDILANTTGIVLALVLFKTLK